MYLESPSFGTCMSTTNILISTLRTLKHSFAASYSCSHVSSGQQQACLITLDSLETASHIEQRWRWYDIVIIIHSIYTQSFCPAVIFGHISQILKHYKRPAKSMRAGQWRRSLPTPLSLPPWTAFITIFSLNKRKRERKGIELLLCLVLESSIRITEMESILRFCLVKPSVMLVIRSCHSYTVSVWTPAMNHSPLLLQTLHSNVKLL